METVLITGGANFVGRAVCARLLQQGKSVKVLDSLVEQVHGGRLRPESLRWTWSSSGRTSQRRCGRPRAPGVDSFVHLAAEVGFGQSMYAASG